MSRTIRKDRNDKKYTEGRIKPEVWYPCNCWLCTGYGKHELKELKEKIADVELSKQIKNENI